MYQALTKHLHGDQQQHEETCTAGVRVVCRGAIFHKRRHNSATSMRVATFRAPARPKHSVHRGPPSLSRRQQGTHVLHQNRLRCSVWTVCLVVVTSAKRTISAMATEWCRPLLRNEYGGGRSSWEGDCLCRFALGQPVGGQGSLVACIANGGRGGRPTPPPPAYARAPAVEGDADLLGWGTSLHSVLAGHQDVLHDGPVEAPCLVSRACVHGPCKDGVLASQGTRAMLGGHAPTVVGGLVGTHLCPRVEGARMGDGHRQDGWWGHASVLRHWKN